MRKQFFILLFCCLGIITQAQTTNLLSGLTAIQEGVKSKRVSSYDRSGGNGDNIYMIKSGESRTIFDAKGAGIITHIWVTIAPRPEQLNRSDIILKMYWDGNPEPSVLSPIGPFFGQGWDESYDYTSLPLSVGPAGGTGMVCYFQMPFANGAKIVIENQADKSIEAFYYYVDYVEMEKLPMNTGRFHAWFNRQITEAPETGENEWEALHKYDKNTTGENNYVFADIKGSGHFVGVNYYVQNPSTMWYGEGDDMFFVDGEKTPSIHGTGTEDYFNTSWCPKTIYLHPFYGYPRVAAYETGWLYRTHMYRFHITDPIYFSKSLKATIEHGHANCLTLDLSSVAYWYTKEAMGVPPIPDKEHRKFMPYIGAKEMLRWRDQWRKSHGNKPTLWGNEE
ncbi:MAG TPA: glycoside hydrolase family 172 protein [Bacteroidales bacterium]